MADPQFDTEPYLDEAAEILGDLLSLHSSPSGTSVSSSSFKGIFIIFFEDRICSYFLPLGIKDFLAVDLFAAFLVVKFKLSMRLKGVVKVSPNLTSSSTFERLVMGFFFADVRLP